METIVVGETYRCKPEIVLSALWHGLEFEVVDIRDKEVYIQTPMNAPAGWPKGQVRRWASLDFCQKVLELSSRPEDNIPEEW